ncbi:MAG: hypothetical protein WB421_11890 [Terriglobales bacterium]
MVSSLNNEAWTGSLEEGFALTNGADLPRRLFHCRLDDQPDHLVPERNLRSRDWEDLSDRPLFINPDCVFAPNGALPTTITDRAGCLDSFALSAHMVWIKDPVRDSLLPFWLGPQFSAALAGLQPGDRAPSSLSSDARRFLAMAEVLVSRDQAANLSRLWDRRLSRCAAEFREKHYAPVAQLIHPFHISALRRYYRHLIRSGTIPLGDSQSPRRYWVQNEAVARFFHQQLTTAVSLIVEEPVKPSYVYFASYQSGAELEAHVDREQCQFTISLCVDYSPEPLRETPWPLRLHTATGTTTVFQGIGDALIYCGCELPHARDPLPRGNTSTSLFFHYVRESFAGKLT